MVPVPVLPTIDVAGLMSASDDDRTTRSIGDAVVAACSAVGAFQVVGHGVDPVLRADLVAAARRFFALDPSEKAHIGMPLAGPAWRGWFPTGGELTAGVPDGKEGIYFGLELPPDDPRVLARTPMHGPNLFPARPAELRSLVLEWMDAVVPVAHAVLRGIAVGLGLERRWFDRWCADPTVLFRIFHYPAVADPPGPGAGWGVGEHTDYGLLTLLAQDGTGGLEVATADEWVEVEPIPDALVCNLGDMLERLSAGRFRATPHRVRTPTIDRISMPLFLDPGWDVVVEPLPRAALDAEGPARPRWDGADLRGLDGPYSTYLLGRVARVFPDLFERVGAGAEVEPRV